MTIFKLNLDITVKEVKKIIDPFNVYLLNYLNLKYAYTVVAICR